MYPRVCIEGDMVLRSGECAEEFFMIKEGKVAILTPESKSQIAVLEKGAFFGEIGLLLNIPRTVNVQALENCTFMCVSKDKFLYILGMFPDQKQLLLKVKER